MIDTIIFDLGGVLIDWNPRYLYRTLFANEDDITKFLAEVCTPDWNEEQDAGRTIAAGTTLLIEQYPQYEKEIRAFYSRWEEMLGGAINDTVDLFRQLKASKRYRFYALTNWSAETFPIALARYDFLSWFDGIVVSGEEKIRKPAPEFYRLLLNRYRLQANQVLFIDDNHRNILAAEALGIKSIAFSSAENLREELGKLHMF